jgi:hypothetical protein
MLALWQQAARRAVGADVPLMHHSPSRQRKPLALLSPPDVPLKPQAPRQRRKKPLKSPGGVTTSRPDD